MEAIQQSESRQYLKPMWKSHAEFHFYIHGWKQDRLKRPKKELSLVQRQFCIALDEMGYLVYAAKGTAQEFMMAEPVMQTDYYFDTAAETLHQANCSLRARIKGDKAELTCKRPVSGSRSCGEQGQMERYEYASMLKDVDCSNISDVFRCEEGIAFVKKYLADLVTCGDLQEPPQHCPSSRIQTFEN